MSYDENRISDLIDGGHEQQRQMETHRLKTIRPYFEECFGNSKTFEVRINDRSFKKGDTVYLMDYDVETNTYSGRELRCTILYVLSEYSAIKKGYVVFSFRIDQYIKATTS